MSPIAISLLVQIGSVVVPGLAAGATINRRSGRLAVAGWVALRHAVLDGDAISPLTVNSLRINDHGTGHDWEYRPAVRPCVPTFGPTSL